MDSPQRSTWQYIALGGACAAVVVSLTYCRPAASKKTDDRAKPACKPKAVPQKYVPAKPSRPAGKADAAPQKVSFTFTNFDELEVLAAGLKKRDAEDLPLVLEATEKVLKEQPQHKALQACLKALTQVVGGNQEADRVSAVAVKAGAHHPEQALELLNVLFKDRRMRGGFVADAAVVEFVLRILQNSLKGGVERGTYQRACRLVDWLSLDSNNRAKLASGGGFETLLKVMEKFHDDSGVMLEGCGTLQSIAEEPLLDGARAIAVSMKCVENFTSNPQLQWRALAALHGLPLPAAELRLPLAKMALAAALKHPRCDTVTTVVEWATKMLFKLAKDRKSDVHAFLRDPAQKPAMEIIRDAPLATKSGKINKEAADACSELCRLCGVKGEK